MRAVRCDVCGSKALLAAATCPKCSHEFQVRDGFGKMLPLAYCSSCDSFYPEKVGECRWCGTKPQRAPGAPYILKTVGLVALAVIVGVAWFVNRDGAKNVADERMKVVLAGDSAAEQADSVTRSRAVAASDSSQRTTAIASGSIATETPDRAVPTVSPGPAPIQRLDSIPQPIEPAGLVAKPIAAPAPKSTPMASSVGRKSARWINSVSRSWVMVHADATKSSRIVASIGPNTRVQLGESRGAWRRIRAKGLAGWVEHGAFVAMLGAPRRTRGLAVR